MNRLQQHGRASVECDPERLGIDLNDVLFDIQVSDDGRVWVCVNGLTWLRFKPHTPATVTHPTGQLEEA